MATTFRVDTHLTDGHVKTYTTDNPEFTAKYIQYMERDKADTIVSMIVTKTHDPYDYYRRYDHSYHRGHRTDSMKRYSVDTIMYYDKDNNEIWSLQELMDFYNTSPEDKETYEDFWQYLKACLYRNNGTLNII